jgi:hypothetical protein
MSNVSNITMENLTKNGAFNASDNMGNFSYSMNMSDYPVIDGMVQFNESQSVTENVISMLGSPLTNYWAHPSVLGPWAYVFLMIVTILMVYAKSSSLEVTSGIMLLMSLFIIVPGMAGAWIIPGAVMMVMYVFAVLAVAGVLLSMFGD